jgi:hypothetical protein
MSWGTTSNLDVGDIDTTVVQLNAYLEVVVHYGFDYDKSFHCGYLCKNDLLNDVAFR